MREIKHEIVINGTPRLENMPKDAFKVFCNSLLSEIEDYYKEEKAPETVPFNDKTIPHTE